MIWFDLVLLGMHDKLADFESTAVSFTLNPDVSSEEFDMKTVGVNVTRCNWRVLFAPNAGVLLVYLVLMKSFSQTVKDLKD